MSLLIPIQQSEALVTNRFTALFSVDIRRQAESEPCLLSVDVTRELDAEPVLLSADIKSGDGVIVFVRATSSIFEAAR
ncbi:MAG: hypothetical protein WBV94_05575 [Blastocatellia bacterium]